ncbi:MAG TPA: hypothetical protein VE244_13205 [Nitrososphaeraceae archaeon]|jgi:hypothetical protein|nr:hypothetical protein [Nitrososphaeraceae archaeon]
MLTNYASIKVRLSAVALSIMEIVWILMIQPLAIIRSSGTAQQSNI